MTAAPDGRVRIVAPAKLNLGLEVIGRRPDGFHDLVTIFQAVSLVDWLTLAPAPDLRLFCADPALLSPDNLALRALARLRERTGTASGASLHLDKHIPVAAGLGGASSDAAAALLAARRLWGAPASDQNLAELAAELGSDLPFFLRGGTALATGRGERLEPLPTPAGIWFVIVSPAVVVPRKTATLYAALTRDDFSDGARVKQQAARLRAGLPLAPDLLVNAFASPLSELRPELAELPNLMRAAGAPAVALSGAGPSHYAVLDDPDAARDLAARLVGRLGPRAGIAVVTPWPEPPRLLAT